MNGDKKVSFLSSGAGIYTIGALLNNEIEDES